MYIWVSLMANTILQQIYSVVYWWKRTSNYNIYLLLVLVFTVFCHFIWMCMCECISLQPKENYLSFGFHLIGYILLCDYCQCWTFDRTFGLFSIYCVVSIWPFMFQKSCCSLLFHSFIHAVSMVYPLFDELFSLHLYFSVKILTINSSSLTLTSIRFFFRHRLSMALWFISHFLIIQFHFKTIPKETICSPCD